MPAEHFSYHEFLALILVYTANASDGISMEEQEFILAKVGEEEYEKCIDFFDQASEVEIIEMINDLSDKFAKNNHNAVFSDLQELIQVDDVDSEVEEQIFRMLKKIL